MGENICKSKFDQNERKAFVEHLIDDIKALELLLEQNLIEDDVIRIGAEQEICLVDDNYRPSGKSLELLGTIDDSHFTTELASFNLEINLDPFELEKNCFSKVEKQLTEMLNKAKTEAKKLGINIVLTGILPTLSKNELGIDFMTPVPRYYKLNEILSSWRGEHFTLKIKGVDELTIRHDSVLFEACNTSFQLHLQVTPKDFVKSYNWAQAIAGPVLGISCNSPLLMGRELWKETRIALFQQSLDTRKWTYALKEQFARVGFGNQWQKKSVVEIFKEDISTHRIVLTKPIGQSSLQLMDNGKIPKLEALNLYNGTVYRWNRPCYGVGNGKPHLRIENRYIPSGPTIIDEIANFAFWVGLMVGRPKKYDDMPSIMHFKEAKLNFIKSARTGRQTVISWLGKPITLKKLVLKELLPIAYEGLKKFDIDKVDIDRLLGVIEARTNNGTGAEWQIRNCRELRKHMKLDSTLLELTKAISINQEKNIPVHEWPSIKKTNKATTSFHWVAQIMSTKLMKLYEDDYVSLALAIMKWNNIHHIPVENNKGELVGLLTWSHIESLEKNKGKEESKVSEIMIKKVITVRPRTKIETAKRLMKEYQIGCLPVCVGSNMVGILSKVDF
ncbi:CBS domain-containing protein [Flagellimonas eckloniae]|uniref:Signal transduction protein n=1 Tax=Flagellimonas eckloniae TaxID=346185 RepID=A0A0Q1H8U3_9FLAO|nr:CBS domain-containing protein [Allomuricauda eckloniae]KQC30082.1 signal transduction protein [Allomuricauda eckloniae]